MVGRRIRGKGVDTSVRIQGGRREKYDGVTTGHSTRNQGLFKEGTFRVRTGIGTRCQGLIKEGSTSLDLASTVGTEATLTVAKCLN